MRALVYDGSSPRLVDDAPEPVAADGEALVRVRCAGICSTDLEILSGYLAFRGIPGHEFVGDVVVGPAEWLGKRVVGEINFACGRCETCAAGHRRHCPGRTVLGIAGANGAFAELVRLPTENLHLVPGHLPDSAAVFIEPTAAAFEVAEQTRERAGGHSLVVGAGKLGLLIAQVLAARGDRVSVLARRDRPAEVARSLGLGVLRGPPRPRHWDLAVDATGDVRGLEVARQAVRPMGVVVLKTTVAARYNLDLASLVIDEITLIGSRCGPFGPALETLAERRVEVGSLIEASYPLRDALRALEHASVPGALKVVLVPRA